MDDLTAIPFSHDLAPPQSPTPPQRALPRSAAPTLADVPLVVVDTETTGASFAYGDRIVEIGFVRIERGQVVHAESTLVDPGRPMTGGASRITGITDDMLAGQPTFEQVWPAVRAQWRGCVLVGHNVSFDLSFLDGECRRIGSSLAEELGEYDVLDTCRLARRMFGRGGNGLQRLAQRLCIEPTGAAHRALADCHTTVALLQRLIEPLGGWGLSVADAVARQGGPVQVTLPTSRQSPVSEEIADMLIAGRPVRITYMDAKQNQSERLVTPRFIRRIRGKLTLVAHCHARNAERYFTLAQILRVEHPA